MMIKLLICVLFHRRHWRKTGDRRWYRVTICYDWRCEKCAREWDRCELVCF